MGTSLKQWIAASIVSLLFSSFFVSTSLLPPEPPPKKENKIFAAVEHMKPLLDLEKAVVSNAKDYLAKQRKILNDLRSFKEELEEAAHLSENQNLVEYLGNPVNTFLLIKRLSTDWDDLRMYFSEQSEVPTNNETKQGDAQYWEDADTPEWLETYDTYKPPVSDWVDAADVHTTFESSWLQMYSMHAPSKMDIDGALSAFIRLQDAYDISARDFSDGEVSFLRNVKLQMTAADCIAVVELCMANRRYVRLKEWLLEAERLITDVSAPHRHGNTTKQYVYEWLVYCYFLEGDAANALKYTELLLADFPGNPTFLQNKAYYGWYAENNVPMPREETRYMAQARAILENAQQTPYVTACVKNELQPKGYLNEWSLRCFVKQDHPMLLLKPIKVTQMHDNPPVYIFHEIMSEKSMEDLKRLATPRIKHAKVVHMGTDDLAEAYYRVSKSMFLLPDVKTDMIVNDRLHPLFEAVTDLSMTHAETLQMNNYGLGGQYELHHDYGEPGTMLDQDANGNRIATLLLYLSDVEYGGHTVFPFIGLSLTPNKGDGVFWYNLHRNGSGIFNSRHAACPVLSGSKWVANKWIRMAGNELKRPCTVNQFE